MTRSLQTTSLALVLLLGAAVGLGCQQAPAKAVSQAPEPAAIDRHQEEPYNGVVLASTQSSEEPQTKTDIVFDDTDALAKKFIAFDSSIQLTPEQERIKAEALSSIPAPCCSEFSMATCCCPCNLAKAAWGLAKHLIAERGYGVDQVREAELRWFKAINPNGFSGTVCATGGCNRSFEQNGCGGMGASLIL